MKHLVIGFHGTDQSSAQLIARRGIDRRKVNTLGWLGPGLYFWEQDERRAWEWCTLRKKEPPVVVKVQLDLTERCLDLAVRHNAQEYRKFVAEVLGKAKYRERISETARRCDGFVDAFFIPLYLKVLSSRGEWGGEEATAVRAVIFEGARVYERRTVSVLSLTASDTSAKEAPLALSRVVTRISVVVAVLSNNALGSVVCIGSET